MKRSFSRGFTLVEIMIVVVIIGVLAVLAIPGFRKARSTSQDRAVLNNARQLAGAAEQYMMEFGVVYVSYGVLVGSSNYVKSIVLVANESYPDYYTVGVTMTISGVGGARTITYGF